MQALSKISICKEAVRVSSRFLADSNLDFIFKTVPDYFIAAMDIKGLYVRPMLKSLVPSWKLWSEKI